MPYVLKESNPVSGIKRLFSATGTWKAKAKSTHVLNSTYIEVQHYLWYLPAKESRPYIFV